MKTIEKIIFTIILTIIYISLFSSTNITAFASVSESSPEDFEYEYVDTYDEKTGETITTITITGYIGKDSDVIIPSSIDGKSVTCIGERAFLSCSSLHRISIPDGVTSIGYNAFEDCSNLTTVFLPDSLTEIEDFTFYNCVKLTSITIPDGVTTIGHSAFSECSQLSKITLPGGLTKIEGYAFYNCSSLTNVTIPEYVTSIGDFAFAKCTSLETIYIPENTTNIETYTFAKEDYGSAMKNLTIYGIADSTAQSYAYRNGISFSAIETYPHIHIYSAGWIIEKEATCTEKGLKVKLCTGCNEISKSEEIPALGHSFTDWEIITSPTCTEKGVQSHICTVCNQEEREEIAALGHTYTSKVVRATCIKKGYTLHTCSVCGDSYKDNYTNKNKCTVCNGSGHSSKKKCPDCSNGYKTTTVYETCSKCKGNGTTTTTEIVDCPSCLGTGLYWSTTLNCYVTCKACSGSGKFPYTKTSDCTLCSGKGQTASRVQVKCSNCNGTGTIFSDCKYCDGTGKVAPGHKTSLQVTKAATCTEEGTQIRVCSVCGIITETNAIKKTAHNYVSTKKADGTIVEKCSTCGNIKSSTATTNNSGGSNTQTISKGKSYIAGSCKYKVTKVSTGSNGTVTLTKVITKSAAVKIPSTIKINGNSYKVTAIGKGAFKNNKKITKLVIGGNVKTIGASAFSGCIKLKSVTIGNKVTTIGEKAFYNCTKLKTLTIGKNVTKIGAKTFYNCKKLSSITIKTKKLKASKVGKNAFGKVKSNVKIKVPKSKKSAYKKILYKKGIKKRTAKIV